MAPEWTARALRFRQYGFGMFVHFGPYSLRKRGEWALEQRKWDPDAYRQDALACDYSGFDMPGLVQAARAAGMKYIVFTARHHDGFSLYDTRGLSAYDVMHTPGGRDLMAEFVRCCREAGIVPFFYHTTLDWQAGSFQTDFPAYLSYLRRSVELLCTHYGEIGGFWFDGNWSKPEADWELDALYGMIRRLQPEAMLVNNTGLQAQGLLSHPEIDCVTYEQGQPAPIDDGHLPKKIVGEVCLTMNRHWGLAEDLDYKSVRELLETTCQCRQYGANMLLNVSPDVQGRLPAIQRGILETLGQWTALHAPAFYPVQPGSITGSGRNFAVEHGGSTYLYLFEVQTWGGENVMLHSKDVFALFYGVHRQVRSARWMDSGQPAAFVQDAEQGVLLVLPASFAYGENWIVRVIELAWED